LRTSFKMFRHSGRMAVITSGSMTRLIRWS
jgi:hypothetical protein